MSSRVSASSAAARRQAAAVMSEQSNSFSLTLARGLQVLELFTSEVVALTTSEVAERLGISRAAARRFLLTLTTLGYLEQTKANFTLTGKIATIGQSSIAREDRWMTATLDVLELANRVDESVSISVLDGMNIRFVVRDQKRRMFSSRLAVGDKLPANCSAAGKVLLASLLPERLDELLAASLPLERRTPNSITDPDQLRQELRRVRIKSWAIAEDEMEIGTISIAVPVFDARDVVVGALAMSSHKMRRSIEELKTDFLPALLDVAEKIGARMR